MDKKLIAIIFVIVLTLSLILLFRLFWTYISAIILALLIASAFYPLYVWLRKLLRGRETTAALLMSLLVLMVLVIPVGGFVGTLSNQAFEFYDRTKDSVSLKKIQEWLESDSLWAQRLRKAGGITGIDFSPAAIERLVSSVGRDVGLYLSRQLRAVASNLLSFLVHFFLMMLIVYYIFRDGMRLKAYISELIPFPVSQQERVVEKFHEMGKAVIFGNGLSGIIQGILGGLGFFLFGLGSPFLWGTLIAFMAFLPIIGASVVFVPATFILLMRGESEIAAGYLVYNVCYSAIMEYLVKPRLIGKGMQMNSLLVFIGILGGIKLFGLLGIVYGPLIITIFFTLAEIYRLEYKEELV